MQKENYKKLMEKEIEIIKKSGKKPTLLLHVCCAPCASAVLELLHPFFEITLFFYNPNIAPESEFSYRKEELCRLIHEMGFSDVSVVVPEYAGEEFEVIACGLEDLPEGGSRCERCYRLRLNKTAAYGRENGFDYMTTTLSISPYKNALWLNEIGRELEAEYDVRYLVSDFKKGEGYKRSCDLSRQYDLYRQNYCGCIYSKQQAGAL